jgi:hypothetical protein
VLVKLIKLINKNPLANLEQLAQLLQVPTGMVIEMVADLSKRGYLKSYEDCASACQNCSLSTSCGSRAHPKIWSLTEKGQILAEKS